jgi:hypothetical protein
MRRRPQPAVPDRAPPSAGHLPAAPGRASPSLGRPVPFPSRPSPAMCQPLACPTLAAPVPTPSTSHAPARAACGGVRVCPRRPTVAALAAAAPASRASVKWPPAPPRDATCQSPRNRHGLHGLWPLVPLLFQMTGRQSHGERSPYAAASPEVKRENRGLICKYGM